MLADAFAHSQVRSVRFVFVYLNYPCDSPRQRCQLMPVCVLRPSQLPGTVEEWFRGPEGAHAVDVALYSVPASADPPHEASDAGYADILNPHEYAGSVHTANFVQQAPAATGSATTGTAASRRASFHPATSARSTSGPDSKRFHNPLVRGICTAAFHRWDAEGNHIGWVGVKEWRTSIMDMLGQDVPLSTSYTWRKAEQASTEWDIGASDHMTFFLKLRVVAHVLTRAHAPPP
jgi:hypothetical protein